MASGKYTYEPDDEDREPFDIEWLFDGDLKDDEKERFDQHIEAAGEKAAEYLFDALDIGEHIKLESVQLRLPRWEIPKLTVWLRIPAGYISEDDDEPDAAEKVKQRKAFSQHNAVHHERTFVKGRTFPLKIDVRPF